jgi:hypothetical protein
VTGSAWMPWLRPIVGVSLCSIGAALEHFEELVEIGEQDVAGAGELDREAGVEHVRAGHALVHEARLVADLLGHPGEEGDDVVLGHGLDRVDRGDVDRRVGRPPVPQRLGGALGHHAEFGERLGGVRLDLEPDAKRVSGDQIAVISGRE